MADRDTRTEATARFLMAKFYGWNWDAAGPQNRLLFTSRAGKALAAADADDRENGIVRVKLDGVFATEGGFVYLSNLLKDSPTPTTLLAVADALREAATRP